MRTIEEIKQELEETKGNPQPTIGWRMERQILWKELAEAQDAEIARLIAAAPRMYELLAEARELFRDGKFNSPKGTEWAIDVRDTIREIDGQEDSHA